MKAGRLRASVLWIVLFVSVFLVAVPLNLVWAASGFSDSFEDGDWSANPQWLLSGGPAPNWDVQTSVVKDGTYSLEGDNAGQSFTGLYTNDFVAQNTPWSLSFFWRYDHVGAWTGAGTNKYWTIAYWYNANPLGAEGIIMESNGTIGLDSSLAGTGVSKQLFSTTLDSVEWHFIEYYVNATAGYLYVNGTFEGSHTMSASINNLVGVTNVFPAQGAGYVAYWDRVVLAAEYQGPPPENGDNGDNGGGVTTAAMNWWFMMVGFVCFVSPPFVIAKRRYGEAANVIILLFVMVIGLALIGAGVS